MLDDLLVSSSDLLHLVVHFLGAVDARSLSATSKAQYVAISSEYLWLQFLQTRVRGLQGLKREEIYALRSMLGFHSSYQMYCSVSKLGFILLGYFRCDKHFGSLFRVKVIDGTIICHLVTEHDEIDKYDEFSGIELKFGDSVPSTTYLRPYRIRITENSMFLSVNRRSNSEELIPLPPLYNVRPQESDGTEVLKQISLSNGARLPDQLGQLLGLSGAQYGPHGTEILHLSIHSPAENDTRNEYHEPVEYLSCMRLRGLKVTGDPNVPHGNLSFTINLTTSFNVVEEIMHDARPFVYLTQNNQIRYDFLHPVDNRIKYWYKGKGQINHEPGQWDPEWVDCSFLIYDTPRDITESLGVLVWGDEEHTLRHAIKIFPMERSNAEIAAGFSYL